MKKIFYLALILIMHSCNLFNKENIASSKSEKEIFVVLKRLKDSYQEKDTDLFFTSQVQCTMCDIENGYDREYFIPKKEFINNNLSEVINFLDYRNIQNSDYNLSKEGDLYVLSYSSSKSDKKNDFEGSSVLISFKQENKIWKIYGIQTIP